MLKTRPNRASFLALAAPLCATKGDAPTQSNTAVDRKRKQNRDFFASDRESVYLGRGHLGGPG